MIDISYLENLARRIEQTARIENNRAKLFKIADEIRQYKDKKYNGGEDPFEGIQHLEAN